MQGAQKATPRRARTKATPRRARKATPRRARKKATPRRARKGYTPKGAHSSFFFLFFSFPSLQKATPRRARKRQHPEGRARQHPQIYGCRARREGREAPQNRRGGPTGPPRKTRPRKTHHEGCESADGAVKGNTPKDTDAGRAKATFLHFKRPRHEGRAKGNTPKGAQKATPQTTKLQGAQKATPQRVRKRQHPEGRATPKACSDRPRQLIHSTKRLNITRLRVRSNKGEGSSCRRPVG